MNRKFRERKKEADRQMKARKYKRDDSGRVIIQMNVKDDANFLSEFSESATPVISTEVAEFIENETNAVPPNEDFTLQVYNDCIDDREEKVYGAAIKEYYMQKYIANEREIKRNRFAVLLLGIAGILVLAAELIFDYRVGNALWSSVIDIVAWVLLWEAVDIGVLEARVTAIKRKRFLAYLSMKTEYIPTKKPLKSVSDTLSDEQPINLP